MIYHGTENKNANKDTNKGRKCDLYFKL